MIFTLSYTKGPNFAASDEGGYLSWARIVSGKASPIESPMYPGYGLLLSPLYVFLDSPDAIWKGVVFLNFLLCTGSLLLAQILHRQLVPFVGDADRLLTLLIVGAYPMFGTMMGYAFTSLPSTFFILVALTLVKSVAEQHRASTVGFVFVSGFLTTLHPTHVIFLIFATWVLVYSQSTGRGRIAHVAGLVTLVLLGQQVVKPLLLSRVTGNALGTSTRYDALPRFLGGLTDYSHYVNFAQELVTISYSVVISSLGLVGVGIGTCIQLVRRDRHKQRLASDAIVAIGVIGMLIGYCLLTAYNFGFTSDEHFYGRRVEEYVFLRYVEPILVPLFIVSSSYISTFSSIAARLTNFFLSCVTVVLGGFALNEVLEGGAGFEGDLAPADFLRFMANGFWPASIVTTPSALWWTLLGGGALCALLVGTRAVYALLLCGVCLLSLPVQKDHYLSFNSAYSNTGELPALIRSVTQENDCIGFDKSAMPQLPTDRWSQWVEYGNFAFQFPTSNLTLMLPKEWMKSCNGPFVSFSSSLGVLNPDVYDSEIGTYLYSKDQINFIKLDTKFPTLIFRTTTSDSCIEKGCFGLDSRALTNYGSALPRDDKYSSKNHSTTPSISTPGHELDQGQYWLQLIGNSDTPDWLGVRILVDGDSRIVFSGNLNAPKVKYSNYSYFLPFSLSQWVSDLRIEISLQGNAVVPLRGLKITSQS